MVTSELAKIDVIRASRRVNADVLPAAMALLAGLDLVPLSGEVVDAAADAGLATLQPGR